MLGNSGFLLVHRQRQLTPNELNYVMILGIPDRGYKVCHKPGLKLMTSKVQQDRAFRYRMLLTVAKGAI